MILSHGICEWIVLFGLSDPEVVGEVKRGAGLLTLFFLSAVSFPVPDVALPDDSAFCITAYNSVQLSSAHQSHTELSVVGQVLYRTGDARMSEAQSSSLGSSVLAKASLGVLYQTPTLT